jgi:hypothetical protein
MSVFTNLNVWYKTKTYKKIIFNKLLQVLLKSSLYKIKYLMSRLHTNLNIIKIDFERNEWITKNLVDMKMNKCSGIFFELIVRFVCNLVHVYFSHTTTPVNQSNPIEFLQWLFSMKSHTHNERFVIINGKMI